MFFGRKKNKNEELVQALTELVQDRIDKNWNHLGIRAETQELEQGVRSKAVRAYFVDLFGNYDEVKGLHGLEEKIGESIDLYYRH